VDLDQQVGDAGGVERREQVLDGADRFALALEGGRVVGVGDRGDVGGDHRVRGAG
jgi:hypothetical protein